MTNSHDSIADDDAARSRAASQADVADQAAAVALRQTKATHSATADSLDRAADSHVAATRIYDDGAEQRPELSAEFRRHAMHHRRSAHDHRETAQQMREIADK